MQKITTFLAFENRAEEAAEFYTRVFKEAKILHQSQPGGAWYSATIELFGQRFILLNGGPHFKFAQGISLFVSCETQEEIDELWNKLTENGREQPCGWLLDPFGVSWQVVPPILGQLLGNRDREKAQRVQQAMLKMKKIVIAELLQAAEGS